MAASDGSIKKASRKHVKTNEALFFVIGMDALVLLLFFFNPGGTQDLYYVLSPLFWQINVVMDYVTLVPLGITLFMAIAQHVKWRYRHALYLVLAWTFLILTTVTRILEKAIINGHVLSFIWYIPLSFSLLFLMDSISRDSIDPKKTIIATALSILYLTNFSSLYIALLIIFLISVAVYYLLTIYWNAPRSLKRYAILALAGGLIFGYGNVFVAYGNVELVLPGATYLTSAVGYVLYMVSFVREPKLAYILPFQVVSLTVFETKGGIPLFSYAWKKNEDMVDESLFSGMLQGIGLVLDEAISAGELEEIKMSHAVLIVRRSKTHAIACVLVATKFSRTLRSALNTFADRFFKVYEPFIGTTVNSRDFNSADSLIHECFAFIPKYDSKDGVNGK